MSQITGEKYQIMNAARTVNRFPITVMEAVLGLNSYLQDQFSSLADIYMPIEGISESKPNQEFVFRKTPNTIKAKALTLDKIKGKTLAWNQLVKNPNFDNLSAWSAGTGTLDINTTNHTASIYSESATDNTEIRQSINIVNNHYYYVRFRATSRRDGRVSVTYYGGARYPSTFIDDILANETKDFRSVYQFTSGDGYNTVGLSIRGSGADFTIYGGVELIDLTLMFGAGNEPSTVAEFEALYPGYHAYNPGALISNDAESLETVGFNQWDEETKSGYYDPTTGAYVNSGLDLCTKKAVPAFPEMNYYISRALTSGDVVFFDSEMNYIGTSSLASTQSFITPSNCGYFVVNFGQSYGTTYNHDICINISDPSRNGQYEPYRKSVCPLNLNKIRVISPNIWDEEWERGSLNSVGQKVDSSVEYRSKNFIPITAGIQYYVRFVRGVFQLFYYDANYAYVSKTSQIDSSTSVSVPSGVCYALFVNYGSAVSANPTYLNDITINKSDPAFNGRYFPYGTLELEGGLKGNGDWADMIVGNKYVKKCERALFNADTSTVYSGGYRTLSIRSSVNDDTGATFICDKFRPAPGATQTDDDHSLTLGDNKAWFYQDDWTTVTEAYLDYKLDYPETYELVTPLVTSMPAGTTEARISPNADGLSAPFCCDITYGMGATGYAETAGVASFALNAQYAEVAARLLNPRTIWGQVFDGSANITGAMTGVSSIDSLMHFDTANGRIGIGISTPLYNLDVAGTFRAAGNTLIGGTLSVDGKIYAGEAEIESIIPSNTEFDSEHSINIPLWRLEEDGEAEFGNTYIRGLLKLRTYYYDDGTFHDATMQYEYDDEDASNCFISADKSIHAPSFVQSSDARLKTNLSPVALTVEQIASAPAVEFNWVGNGQRGAGSIAQYWEEQLPYNVHRNGELLTMEYGNIALISAIVCARKIQELEEQVKKLEAKLNV